MKHSGTGRRAIVGVALLAFSVMSLLAVATFDAHDRLGPGFKNAVGPVGHAIAEALRGLLGICAYVLPMVGPQCSEGMCVTLLPRVEAFRVPSPP